MIQAKGYAKERIYADCAEPKSNEELRRCGISRVTPSVKGRDSILYGIAVIQDYHIIVHPSCTNTIMELSSYCWGQDKLGKTINKPVDENNHLMDALRYGMEDIKYFHPADPSAKKKRKGRSLISAGDMEGNWGF